MKKVGEYNVIDGQWCVRRPKGLENKGRVQDVRMYDQLHKDNRIDTIALFRRISNRRFFYAMIIPIQGTKDTQWKTVPRSEVPQEILDDLKTINPHGHEPCQ